MKLKATDIHRCPACKGTGTRRQFKPTKRLMECEACHGKGYFIVRNSTLAILAQPMQ